MGGSSSTSTNSYLPGATQAATTGNAGLQSLLSSLSAKAGQGLSAEQQAYYTGTGDQAVIANTEGQQSNYLDQLSRMGNTASTGAATEGLSSIARSGVQGQASVQNAVTGQDINQQQTNLTNLMAAIKMAIAPNSTSVTTNNSPSILSDLGAIF